MVVILMGVSGAGKRAVGELLAKRLGWTFLDADDLHPTENILKMAAGVELTDEDRLPWLGNVRDAIADHIRSGLSAVVACSALKKRYRDLVMNGHSEISLVHLHSSPDVFERRLRERRGHFFDPNLLASQLETLEEPAGALVVEVDGELETVVDAVVAVLGLPSS